MIKTEKRYEDGSLRERIRMIKVMTSIYIKHTGSETTHNVEKRVSKQGKVPRSHLKTEERGKGSFGVTQEKKVRRCV